jgi:hypothetical protein
MAEISVTGGGVPSLTNTLTDTHIFVGDSNNEPADVALTLSATGGTFALANTGVLTMPNADAVTRGLLTAADWNTFNNKQNAIADWTTAFNSGTQATSSWTATNAAANVNAAIIPKGTGALIANIPDGTATGGNARGQYSVDFQRSRNNAAQIASGNSYSTILNGNRNTASNNYSAVLGGEQHNASGQYTIIAGGIGNTSSQSYCSVFNGNGNTANTVFASVFAGYINTASGYASFVGCGEGNTSSGTYSSIQGGAYATANLYGQLAHASGQISTSGDAQAHELVWRRLVTGAPVGGTELFLDGSSAAAILPSTNAIWHGIIDIAAICTATGNGTTVTGDVEATSYKVTIKRIGTTTSLVGTVQEIGITNADTSMASSVFTIDNNDTNESLRIVYTSPVTAGSTTTIRVVATFRGLQIKY